MAALVICCCMCASTASTIQSVSRIPAARLARTQRPLVAAGTRRWIRESDGIFELMTQVRAVPVAADPLELFLAISAVRQCAARGAAASADLVAQSAGLAVQVGEDVARARAREGDGAAQLTRVDLQFHVVAPIRNPGSAGAVVGSLPSMAPIIHA